MRYKKSIILLLLASAAQANPFLYTFEDQGNNELQHAYIFLSFSMPNQSIKQWLLQADRLNIPCYFRGLYRNSISLTNKKLLKIMKDLHFSIKIDPTIYSAFEIERVPALVLEQQGKIDRVFGNVSLDVALSAIETEGKFAHRYAHKLLQKWQDSLDE